MYFFERQYEILDGYSIANKAEAGVADSVTTLSVRLPTF
jgi:hypothetical protein